jgi:hypothetical protein
MKKKIIFFKMNLGALMWLLLMLDEIVSNFQYLWSTWAGLAARCLIKIIFLHFGIILNNEANVL